MSSQKKMAECHKSIALSSVYLIRDRVPFETNDSVNIKIELRRIIKVVDQIVQRKYRRVQDFYSDMHNAQIQEWVHEFINMTLTYLREPLCVKGDLSFIDIFINYLCSYNCKKLNILYHYLANAGIIMSGCTRIYFNDSSLKGTEPTIIDDPEFFLRQIINAKYRVSKTRVKKCILETFQKTGVRHLMLARALIVDATRLRKETKNICKTMFDTWSTVDKNKHEKFESDLSGIVEQLDIAIRKLG